MLNMKAQRICPKCQQMHIVEPTAENSNTYFLCSCGETLSILESTAEPVFATMCPACSRSHICAVSVGSVLCQCSVVFNPKNRSIISAGRLKSVTCGNCSRVVTANSQSSVVVCSCGTGLYLGQTVQRMPEEVLRAKTPIDNDLGSRPSLADSSIKARKTSGTYFVTAPLASYSLQAEMARAGIGSVEKLFEELDVIRANLRQARIIAERFDVSVDPNVLRVVLSRLFISSSVALHYAKHQLGSNDKEKFKNLLITAGITFIPVVHTQTSEQLLEFVTETIVTSAKVDGRVDPSGAISGLFDLQILYDRSLLVSPLTEDYEPRNARALVATILIWLSATVEEHLEDACRFALIGESGRALSHREYVAHLWAFGRAIARQEGWEWGS